MDNAERFYESLKRYSGIDNIYFQPPANIRMTYPAIVYELSDLDDKFANNNIYNRKYVYTVTVITKEAFDEVFNNVSRMPNTRFDRPYVSNNLYHYVFTIYN